MISFQSSEDLTYRRDESAQHDANGIRRGFSHVEELIELAAVEYYGDERRTGCQDDSTSTGIGMGRYRDQLSDAGRSNEIRLRQVKNQLRAALSDQRMERFPEQVAGSVVDGPGRSGQYESIFVRYLEFHSFTFKARSSAAAFADPGLGKCRNS